MDSSPNWTSIKQNKKLRYLIPELEVGCEEEPVHEVEEAHQNLGQGTIPPPRISYLVTEDETL